MEETQALSVPFFSTACSAAQSGSDEELGSTGEPAKPKSSTACSAAHPRPRGALGRRWVQPRGCENPILRPPVRRLTGRVRHGGDASALCSIILSCLLGGSIRVRRGVGVDRRTSKTQNLNLLFGGSPKAPWGPWTKMGATTRLRKSHLATACAANGLCLPS